MQNTDDEFLTPRELSARYKNLISERTLANWRSTRQGPTFVKVGGRVMYPVGAVTDWEASRQSPPAPKKG